MLNCGETNLIQFSKRCSTDAIRKRPLKIHGEATSSEHRMRSGKQPPPLIALSEERPIRPSLLLALRSLDAEQQQIMEIIAGAMARGAL